MWVERKVALYNFSAVSDQDKKEHKLWKAWQVVSLESIFGGLPKESFLVERHVYPTHEEWFIKEGKALHVMIMAGAASPMVKK